MNSDPILVDILSWLNGVKLLNGSKSLPISLRKHPMIKNYLENYLKDKAVDIENAIASL